MKPIDILLMLPILAWAAYALASICRGKVHCGGCSGDCAHCAAACKKAKTKD